MSQQQTAIERAQWKMAIDAALEEIDKHDNGHNRKPMRPHHPIEVNHDGGDEDRS